MIAHAVTLNFIKTTATGQRKKNSSWPNSRLYNTISNICFMCYFTNTSSLSYCVTTVSQRNSLRE